MEVFEQAVSGVLIILIIIALGFILARNDWFDSKMTSMIARLVTQIALPAYMVSTIVRKFKADQLLKTLPDLVFPVISMFLLYIISIIIVKVCRIPKMHAGLFESMFSNSNTVFVGLPVNMALFGPHSLPFVLVYYMANTTFFWTLGVYLIRKDGSQQGSFSLKTVFKKVFSPPLLGFMVGVLLVLWHVKLPQFIMQDFDYVGNLTIPLSMIFIGISINSVDLSNVHFDRSNFLILFGRFLLAPTLMSLLVIPTPMPLLMKQVFIMQSAMPIMTNAPVVSRLYHADSEYASIMVAETTLLSLIVIPVLMVLVQQF
ncbi:MAG: AEC family transporter [Lentilactobacillus diolivorans]|jgi:predicted permease|uniref:Auxin efflux carrier n=2 Tax=Lentilactobacillus diolivorans TaxID=179838 RepID=A0A0R1S4Z0_9LACO|nr:AEC family transporter [Lentilactobacillus diolivorans]RRG01386.1 MAG: AEC family transporter [Lactobacillus sp.]KRL64374.1 auxin efflux carrier [Lentilactobacillus diolivorans DSM 14421]MCH4165796.1 AEC family transporter [Lentilactobacillus diolivorans]MDH5105744.1 AEC family transporter [Lentilactobacillus diolivorans]GEP23133.1 malate transporter [Lentilactobacillus diolivorans]